MFSESLSVRLPVSEAIHIGMLIEQVAQTPKMRHDAVDRNFYDAINIYMVP